MIRKKGDLYRGRGASESCSRTARCQRERRFFGSGAGDFPDEVSSTNRSPSNNKIFRGGESLILIFRVVTVHLVKIPSEASNGFPTFCIPSYARSRWTVLNVCNLVVSVLVSSFMYRGIR